MDYGPVAGPGAWYGRELARRGDWIRSFSAAEVREIEAAVRAVQRAQVPFTGLTPATFPLPTLDWLNLVESGIFDSASWPNPRETEYGLYPHPALRLLDSFDADRHRGLFQEMRQALRPRLAFRRCENVGAA